MILNFREMKTLFAFLFVFFAGTVPGQTGDTVHVLTHHKNGAVNEDYNKINGLKSGEYKRYTRYDKIYIKGNYSNDSPTGIWEFYAADSAGKLIQRLDFDNHTELYVDSSRAHSLICGPRYFGGNMMQYEYIAKSIRAQFTPEEKRQMRGKAVNVFFTIDSITLKPGNCSINDATVANTIAAKMMRIVSVMPVWLPPVCKTDAMVWRFSVPFLFPDEI